MPNQHNPNQSPPPNDQTDLQQGMAHDFDKLVTEDEKKDKKKGKTYTEDVNDPAYVEPRLRPDWTPDQPG